MSQNVSSQRAARLAGDVILVAPLRARILVGLVLAVVVAAMFVATTATYVRKETVEGWVVPEAGIVRITARQGGVVQQVSTQEGRRLTSGGLLAQVRLQKALSGGEAFELVSRSLLARADASRDRAEASHRLLAAETEKVAAKLALQRQELAELIARTELQEEKVALVSKDLERAEQVAAQGFLSQRDLTARRAAALQERQTAASLRESILARRREIVEGESRLRAIPIETSIADADAASALAELREQTLQAEGAAIEIVTTPVAGRVAVLAVRPGDSVGAGQTLAIVTPDGSKLEAELYAPSKAAGFLAIGQEVRLMYRAFPYQKFGTARGVIVSVSRTVIAPNDLQLPGLQITEPVVRIVARLDRQTVRAYGKDMRLQPGVLTEATKQSIRRYMDELKLTFGAFDFAVTPAGEVVFFECNPAGQWLWMEHKLDVSITRDVAHMLRAAAAGAAENRRPAAGRQIESLTVA